MYGQELAGLLPSVGEGLVFEVGFPQMGHVDEGHSPGVEGEEKQVSGQGFLRGGG